MPNNRYQKIAVGEKWYVKLPRSTNVIEATIVDLTDLTCNLRLDDISHFGIELSSTSRFVIEDINFLEKIDMQLKNMDTDDTNDRFTTDQIVEMVVNANLGSLPDGNTVAGAMSCFFDGATQAMYNIVHLSDVILNFKQAADDDVWEQGYATIAIQYQKLVKERI